MKMKKKNKLYIMSLCVILFSVMLYSQGPPPPPGDDDSLPIDGGISLLIVAGVAYGVYEKKRKK